jgi:hypothetical protein
VTYVMGQATVPSSSTVPLFTVPPGFCNVTMYNLNTVTSVFVGTSTAVTTANGLQCHSIPTSFSGYIGSKGATFYGTTGVATASSVNYIISTAF